jgi:hypothetical protein
MSALAVEVAYDVMNPAPKILDSLLLDHSDCAAKSGNREFILPDLDQGRKQIDASTGDQAMARPRPTGLKIGCLKATK